MLSPLLWLWPPLIWMVIQALIEVSFDERTLVMIHSEGGPHETLQFLAIFSAFVIACVVLWKMDRRANPWLTAWVALATLCSLYVAGEEISWGQHILHWTTPEYWQGVNDQQETNLHNTSSWLDQKPRWVLEIGMFAGGLLVPLLRRTKPGLLPEKFAVIYPPAILGLTAGIAALVKIVEEVADGVFDVKLFHRSSEILELYMFWFVMLYMLVMKQRLVKKPGA